jgi:demethylmenaquinone methyltransferase/2-methoxy-6-polyprenyl-1,4-benzoquinol methylase
MLRKEKEILVKSIFSDIALYIDPLDTAFSFGLCHLWRKKLVSCIRKGAKVLDICTGTGELAYRIAGRVGEQGSVTGVDFCEEMLDIAKSKLSPQHKNVSFLFSNAQDLGFPANSFDVVTVSFGIRNIPDTFAVLNEVKRVLKPGGQFLCLELAKPQKRWLRPLYHFYTFTVMHFIAKVITKTTLPYSYLPRSIEEFYPPAEFMHILTECGFSQVHADFLSLGVATLYRAIRHD